MKHQESHITAHQYPMAMNRELLFRQHCLRQRTQYETYRFKLDSVYLKTKTIWRITGNGYEFNTRLWSQFKFVLISIFQDLFERSKFSRPNDCHFYCWKINSLCLTHNRIAIWSAMQRFICHFVTVFSTICRDSMMKSPFVVDLMTHALKKWQLKYSCRKTVHSFANVCPDVSKSAMILKFQWHHCFSKHHCWRKKGSPDRMCPLCIFSTKITISEARKRMNSSDSRNFYVNIFFSYNWAIGQNSSNGINAWYIYWLELTANTGGLLGIFMGFSVFSFVEMFYFLTIRPYCHYVTTSDRRRQAFNRIFKRIKNLRPRTKPSPFNRRIEHADVHENHIVYPYVG